MQRERGSRNDLFDMGDPFSIFGGFGSLGSHTSMMPGVFGGTDPFNDPFFTRPFGSISEPRMFNQIVSSSNKAQTSKSNSVVIEELNPDHEGEKEDKGPVDGEILSRSGKEPSVEHPDDDADDWKNKDADYINQHVKVKGPQPQAHNFGFQTCRVTYGGVDGAYYTSTRTRRTGNDIVLLEERKEADKTTGQATHRVSRGIHDKGHSYTRKLNSDGKVDTLQTLHNLKEDELAGFEEEWKDNANMHLPGWNDVFDMHHNAGSTGDEQERATWGDWALPSLEQTRKAGAMILGNEARTSIGNGGKPKKTVRINID